MKRLSLKKIAFVLLLVPFFALADNSWNDTKDDGKSYYAGTEANYGSSCTNHCKSNYPGSKAQYIAANKEQKTEASCTCTISGVKHEAKLENTQ